MSSARSQHAQPSAFHTLPVTVSQAVLSCLKEPKLWCPSAPTPPDSGSFPPKLGSESQTVAHKPDVVHCLFSHNLRAKNGFYIYLYIIIKFKKREDYFMTYETYRKYKFHVNMCIPEVQSSCK